MTHKLGRVTLANESSSQKPGMTYRLAILVAGALIAASILIVFRWQVAVGGNSLVRVDRWTGWYTVCVAQQDFQGRTKFVTADAQKPCPFWGPVPFVP